jgi:hypothetical protein
MSRFRLALLALFVSVLTILLAGCQKVDDPPTPEGPEPSEGAVRWFVAPSRVDCVGEGVQKCLLVKEEPEAEWRRFYDSIEGFEYQEGYLYEILVDATPVENPPADASSMAYRLVRIVSKTRG